ncbi:hypothetical protein [Prevotella ihumii]|uniref:hypothetical protein n=1 Tax=Prevotella ihumii TaxID=1917878 RepID=UPI000981E0A0|nr:hypothetical protein [Prevotella ihumii]
MDKLLLNGVGTLGSVVSTYTVGLITLIIIGVSLLIILYRILKWIIRVDGKMSVLREVVQTYKQLQEYAEGNDKNSFRSIDDSSEIIEVKDATIVVKNKKDTTTTSKLGYHSAAVNTADNSIAEYEGLSCVISNTGERSLAIAADKSSNCIVSCTGFKSVSESKGYFSIAANVGDYSVATSSGRYSAAINIAGYSIAVSTGDYSVAVATSEKSFAKVEGKDSIAIVCGTNGKASGRLGCWLILTERGEWNGKEYTLKDVKSIKVDGKKIKEDTWYKLENGEIIEEGSSEDKIDP